MSEENIAMVRQLYEAIWREQNMTFVAAHFASDFLGRTTTDVQGPHDMVQRIGTLFEALRDGEFTIQDQVAEGDKVVTRWVTRGVQIGAFEGMPPTGKIVTITGVDLFRLAHGKIIEGWCTVNRPGVALATPATHEEEDDS